MKKLVFLLLAFLLTFSQARVASPVYASWVTEGYAECMEAAEDGEVCGEAHVSNVDNSLKSKAVGDIMGPVEGITVVNMNSPLAKRMLKQSAIYNLSSYITAMYLNPPASTYAFVQDMGQTLGFIPKSAYAQGVGFSGLSALLPIWKVFRNMAYFLLAIVMVVIGFMVMFRKKIDPKTVVTVQNALPRIVIALLLITFSYAIVGVMIDIMYLLIAIVGGIFQSSGLLKINQTAVLNGQLWGSIFTINPWQLPFRMLGITDTNWMTTWGVGGTVAGIIAATLIPTGGFALLGLVPFIAGAAPILVAFLFAIAMLLLFLRLFFFFIGVYIKIIISLLFAPFLLLTEAIPGSKAFDGWIRGLTANLLIFPASTALFLTAAVFLNFSDTKQALWAPPYTTLINNTTAIGAIVALGLLFMIPTVGKQINEAFKAKPGVQAGIGEIGGMLGAPGQIAFQLFQMGMSRDQMKKLGENISKTTGGGGGSDTKSRR